MHRGRAVDALTSDEAGAILTSFLGEQGAELRSWRVRAVHRRGSSAVAVVHEVALRDADGRDRARLVVAHASTRPVPDGAARVALGDAVVHLWQFPEDPYLPGLPDAVHRPTAVALLRRHGRGGDPATTPIRTRSYRPTRRAVVRVGPAADPAATIHCKLLGDRTPDRVAARARGLAAVHGHLAGTLPVPEVLEVDERAGMVALITRPGTSLREQLRGGVPSVAVDAVLAPVTALHRVRPPPGGADPDRFAAVSRHVALLRDRLPAHATQLDELAAATAEVAGPRATVHGDLHCGQLLVTGDRVTGLLDVDGCGTGLVAHDLGRLVAHAEAATTNGADAARRWVEDLTAACADLVPASDLAAAAAAAWTGLATGPLRVADDAWREQATVRLDRASAWLGR